MAAFKDDSTRIGHVIVISIFSFLALLAVIFRLWARRIQRTALELSDYLIVVGVVWTLALGVFTTYSNVYWSLGTEDTQVHSLEAIHKFVVIQGRALIVGQITWAVSVFFIRASILALYIRIFPTKSFSITAHTVHGINAAFLISTVLAACLICRPISFNWDRSIPGGVCGDQKKLDLYIGVFNLLLDVTVIVLPMPVLWGLQMAVNKKLILSGIFGLGIVICITTLVRVKITTENHGSNAQAVYSVIALLTCLEAQLGVVNACLPVLKPLYNKASSSKAKNWLSSIMSGSIPMIMRPSQLGSNGKSKPSSAKQTPRNKSPLPRELQRWPSSYSGTAVGGVRAEASPLPTYVDEKPATMIFGPHGYRPLRSPSLKSSRPPVPPKSRSYSPTKRWENVDEKDMGTAQGIYVRREWDVERGRGEEADIRGLVRSAQRW